MGVYSFDLKFNPYDKTFDIDVKLECKRKIYLLKKKRCKRETRLLQRRQLLRIKKEKENGIYYSYEGVEYLRVDGMSHVFLPKNSYVYW